METDIISIITTHFFLKFTGSSTTSLLISYLICEKIATLTKLPFWFSEKKLRKHEKR